MHFVSPVTASIRMLGANAGIEYEALFDRIFKLALPPIAHENKRGSERPELIWQQAPVLASSARNPIPLGASVS